LLCGTQRLVKQNLGRAVQHGQGFDLVGLATSHEQSGIRRFAFAGDARHGL
jgi:hypothetical protein